jgi:hypothetical protein
MRVSYIQQYTACDLSVTSSIFGGFIEVLESTSVPIGESTTDETSAKQIGSTSGGPGVSRKTSVHRLVAWHFCLANMNENPR